MKESKLYKSLIVLAYVVIFILFTMFFSLISSCSTVKQDTGSWEVFELNQVELCHRMIKTGVGEEKNSMCKCYANIVTVEMQGVFISPESIALMDHSAAMGLIKYAVDTCFSKEDKGI